METKILNSSSIDYAAELIKNGEIVGMPTETVYGLAADALNPKAVANIFKAKGRPMDNPLIVHIAKIEDAKRLVSVFSNKAQALANRFWPGPLTIVMPKSDIIPDEVSAGLSTVAVRYPFHPVAESLILAAGTPLAAPSANLSGSPSPTDALHVYNDLKGKIPAIIDGGRSTVGLESTVITVATKTPKLLRPGGITLEELEETIGKVEVDYGVLSKINEDTIVSSPGMKYKHYAPKTKIVLLKGTREQYINYVNSKKNGFAGAMCYNEDKDKIYITTIPLGDANDYESQAHSLFDKLRFIDTLNLKVVYANCPQPKGVGMALFNRLIRAAGFEVKNLA